MTLEILCLLLNFGEKWALTRPKADKRGFYVYYLIVLKNKPKIGRRPIKGDFMFFIQFCWEMNRKIVKFWGKIQKFKKNFEFEIKSLEF